MPASKKSRVTTNRRLAALLIETTQAFNERLLYEISRSAVSKVQHNIALVAFGSGFNTVADTAGWRDDFYDVSAVERPPASVTE